jgi:hypothetical protein
MYFLSLMFISYLHFYYFPRLLISLFLIFPLAFLVSFQTLFFTCFFTRFTKCIVIIFIASFISLSYYFTLYLSLSLSLPLSLPPFVFQPLILSLQFFPSKIPFPAHLFHFRPPRSRRLFLRFQFVADCLTRRSSAACPP